MGEDPYEEIAKRLEAHKSAREAEEAKRERQEQQDKEADAVARQALLEVVEPEFRRAKELLESYGRKARVDVERDLYNRFEKLTLVAGALQSAPRLVALALPISPPRVELRLWGGGTVRGETKEVPVGELTGETIVSEVDRLVKEITSS